MKTISKIIKHHSCKLATKVIKTIISTVTFTIAAIYKAAFFIKKVTEKCTRIIKNNYKKQRRK